MKKFLGVVAFVCLALCVRAQAQNWTSVTASDLTDLNQQKLAAGSLCFLGTDQNDIPISFEVGGGGQVLTRAFCVSVSNGASAALSVPNPANTAPAGIYYRVTATDNATGQQVLKYTQVQFTGATFNLDSYAPTNIGLFTAPSGLAVTGNFSVNGNIAATGSITGAFSLSSSSFSALNFGAAYGSIGAVSDKQRGVFIQNYLQTHWVPISPWLNLDNYTKGDAVFLNAACSFTNGNYTVTCSGASFSSTDVGKLVVLYGARGNGSGATATTTLSGGAVTTPAVTAAGSGYLTTPNVTVSGLTCTYVPELKAVLSASNYSSGNTVSSITVVYGGSGCTGTPSITITAGPALALAGSIVSVTNSTTIVLTTNIAPSVTASSQSMLYGSDDTSNINSALQALAPNSDEGLNPLAVYCGRLYLTSGTINVENKSLNLLSPGPANLSSTGSGTPSQQGCGFVLVNQSYSSPTDAIYIAGAQFSSVRGVHVYGVSGNKQRAAIRLQQLNSIQNHNTQYNRFEDNLIGPWFTGGANGNDPEAGACTSGSFVLNQCAQFQYGFFLDQPNANNDQMVFSNNLTVGTDIGFFQYAAQSTEMVLDRFMCIGCGYGADVNSYLICRMCDFSSSTNADWLIVDPLYNGVNLGPTLSLDNFTSEGSHQYIVAGAESSAVNNITIYCHGACSWQVGSNTIKSGKIIDFSQQAGPGPNLNIVTDTGIARLLSVLPATTAPINYALYPSGEPQGPNLTQDAPDAAFNQAPPSIASLSPFQLSFPDARHWQKVKWFWSPGAGAGQPCQIDMLYFGGSADNIGCNTTNHTGEVRIYGQLNMQALGQPGGQTCSKLSGSGSTTYYYKIAPVVGGTVGQASAETSCSGQAASLSAAAVNQVGIVPIAGAQQYAIYESTSSGTEKLLATVAVDAMQVCGSNLACYNDTAGGAAGASPLNTDTTGAIVAPSLNINGDGTMTKVPRIAWSAYLATTTNNPNVVFAQWSNSTPLKITTINVIATSSPAGCSSSTQFFVHDVAQSTNSAAATVANGSGSGFAGSLNFAVAAGDTVQLMYTATGCTTQAQLINVAVEVQPQ